MQDPKYLNSLFFFHSRLQTGNSFLSSFPYNSLLNTTHSNQNTLLSVLLIITLEVTLSSGTHSASHVIRSDDLTKCVTAVRHGSSSFETGICNKGEHEQSFTGS